MLGYRPAMFFNDSFDYLHAAMDVYPHPLRPNGYSFLLLIFKPFHSFALVVAVQHLMGLAMGLMIYALLRRRFGLPGWGAALATVPVLLDAYQIQLEHLILSDAPFTFLIVSAITLVLWHARPSWQVAAGIGLLLGAASLTRTLGLPVLLVVVGYMVLRRVRWRIVALTLVSGVLPLIAYSGWFYSEHQVFNTTESNGIFLYARVYKFADCDKIKPPVDEIPFCVQAENRLPNSQDGIWNRRSPLRRFPEARFSSDQNARASSFSKRAITAQPGDYLQVVAHDFFRVFRWERTVFPDKDTYRQYEFEKEATPLPDWRMSNDATAAQEAMAYEQGNARTRVVEPFAGVMRTYQDHVYLRGTLLGFILLIALAGMLPLWRRFGGAALVPVLTAVGLLLAPAATAEFDYRYILPTVPLACLAAAMAFSPEIRGRVRGARRRRATDTEDTPAEPDPEPALR
ncbi:hypothetical protein DPM19_26255 [Actinomadura craniellae]|uniref:Glycosyltransferase RgtA/B/C/D-like domain-containing protein n=2 Tax=Actinomadura craniellae TaxID=2231787 RepID=A0A365GZQ9_9ACTN|nr:hypothetical protein DPM19_26255 [Actinomadura craniellae]